MGAPKGHLPYNKNGEGGRPIVWTDEAIDREADALLDYMNQDENLFVEKFALSRGYHPQRFGEWNKIHDRFASIYARCKKIQEIKLVERGLFGIHKEQMSKFVLVNHHNYLDKSQIEAKVDGSLQIKTVAYNDAE